MAIYLVRHGQAKEYKKDQVKYPGPGLTKNGIEQAKAVAKEIKNIKFNKVYCSDMTRAIQTAEYINKFLKKKISYHRDIAEFNMIVFSKNPKDENKYKTNLRRAKRTRSFFKKIKKEKGNILIVGHGNAISSMISEHLGIPVTKMKMFYIENCSVVVIDNKVSIYNNTFEHRFYKYHMKRMNVEKKKV